MKIECRLLVILLFTFNITVGQEIEKPVLVKTFGLSFYSAFDKERIEYFLSDPISLVSFEINGLDYIS